MIALDLAVDSPDLILGVPCAHGAGDLVRPFHARQVPALFDHDQPRIRNVGRLLEAVLEWRRLVLTSTKDERRAANARQARAAVRPAHDRRLLANECFLDDGYEGLIVQA